MAPPWRLGRLPRAECPCQQTVFTASPAGDEECIDEMPEKGNRQSDDRQREKELGHGNPGAVRLR